MKGMAGDMAKEAMKKGGKLKSIKVKMKFQSEKKSAKK
jgi:hypothetical protein